jgi:hypothetical protein
MQLEDIMLSEVSKVQKDKDHMFSLICGRQIQMMNIYTKPTQSYANLHVERVCNSGTTLWNWEGERKEKRMIVNNIKIR